MIYPYIVTFFSSILASSIFPFTGEAVLFGFVLSKIGDTIFLLIATLLGYIIGDIINYSIGRFITNYAYKGFCQKNKGICHRITYSNAVEYYKKYGEYSLAFLWLPYVGPSIVTVSGAGKLPPHRVLNWIILMHSLRVLVLAVIIYAIRQKI